MQHPGWTAFGAILSILMLLNNPSAARDRDWVHTQEPLPIWVNDCLTKSNLLYVTGRNELRIFDTSSPGNIPQLGSTPTSAGHDLVLLGSALYQATYSSGVLLFDVADPRNPRFVTNITSTGSGAGTVAVSGDCILASVGGSFQVIQTSNGMNPRIVGQTQIDGEVNSIKVKDNIAFVTAGASGLHLIDIQDKIDPKRIGGFSTNQHFGPVLVSSNIAFVGAQRGFFTFDVSNPPNLRKLSFTDRLIPVRDWSVSEGKLYLMTSSDLTTYDFSDPTNLRPEHLISFKNQKEALTIDRHIAYVGGFDEMEIISLSSSANPQSITNVFGTGMFQSDVDLSGNFAYVTDESEGLHIVSLLEGRSSAAITNLGAVATAVGEEFAYVADLRRGIAVVDIRDPAHPAQAGFYDSGRSQDVYLQGTYLYVANFTNDLVILDVSSPAEPVPVSQLALPGFAVGVVVEDETAYVSGSNGGLHLVDVRNKEDPRLLSSITGAVICATAKGKAAYASLTQNRMLVVDCSNPNSPRVTATLATRGWPVGMTIEGSYLYVAELTGGVEVFDISHPLAPRRVGGNSRYLVTRIAASPERIYFATRGDGLTPAYKFKNASIDEFSRNNSHSMFKLQGPPAVAAALEFTSDFAEWFEASAFTFGEAPSEVSQPSSGAPQQFYRLKLR